MAKKYLTLEEAADLAGINAEELRRLREQGDVRGFADRGTWKFKQEDIEELARRRQADSDPDVPMLDDEDSSVLRTEDVGEQPTVIRGSALDDEDLPSGGTSDSDVRLILDDTLTSSADSGKGFSSLGDSDSDVRLVEDSGPSLLDDGSDSDVKLVGTDADIPLLDDEGDSGSDSDVRLVGTGGDTQSDVRLVDTPQAGSEARPRPGTVKPAGSGVGGSGVARPGKPGAAKPQRNMSESDIQLAPAGAILPTGDSGILLDLDDDTETASVLGDNRGSGLGSGIVLASESGISLEGPADSGISLESADSGIALAGLADSGISLADDDDDAAITLADSRSPTTKRGGPVKKGRGDDDTSLEVPTADDSEFELAVDDDDHAETSVILFDEDEAVDQRSATVIKGKGKGRAKPADEDEFDIEAGSDDFAAAESFEGAVVADDDLVGEDDELDFVEAGDEDFDDEFASGESHSDFAAPVGGRVAAPVEQDWGAGTFAGLAVATLLMTICGVVMFDLVRYMWSWGEPSAFNSALLNSIGGLFKG